MKLVPPWRESGWDAQLIEPPLRDELLDVERLQDHARALAARLTVDPRPRRRRRLLGRLEDNARVLARTYRLLADDVRARQHVSPAGEWMLDNYHLVLAEIRSLREYLPRRYYEQLPVLARRRSQRRGARRTRWRSSWSVTATAGSTATSSSRSSTATRRWRR